MTHKQLLTFFDYDVNEFEKYATVSKGLPPRLLSTRGYYLYELRQPLTSRQFFWDSNLNVHLLYRGVDDLYEYLEKQFVLEPKQPGFINLTKSFNEVYPKMDQVRTIDDDGAIFFSNTSPTVKYPLHYPFDFELFWLFKLRIWSRKEAMMKRWRNGFFQEAALFNFDAEMMNKWSSTVRRMAKWSVPVAWNGTGILSPIYESRNHGTGSAAMTEEEFNATVPGRRRIQGIVRHWSTIRRKRHTSGSISC